LSLRIVGISSSPRKANTELLLQEALRAASESPFPVEIEFVSFVGKRIEPCTDCQVCATQKRRCIKQDDWDDLVSHIVDPTPNGLLIGSPVYFFDVNAQLRAFFERCTSLLKGLWIPDYPFAPPDFSRTAAAAISVGFHRNGGVEHAMATIINWCLTVGCVCTGSDYIGGSAWQLETDARDAVRSDELGMRNARVTGRNVAYLAYLLSPERGNDAGIQEEMRAYRNREQAMS